MHGKSIHIPTGGTRRWLVQAAQHGDTAAQEQLVRQYEPLVRSVVWKLRLPRGCEREDVAQDARIGLLAAIRAWRPDRGPFQPSPNAAFTTRPLLAVHAAARHKHQLLSRALSLNADHGGGAAVVYEPMGCALLDLLPTRASHTDPEARVIISEQLSSMVRALPTLTPSERRALTGSITGKSYEQLASAFGGTPKAASQSAYRARRKLAAALPQAA